VHPHDEASTVAPGAPVAPTTPPLVTVENVSRRFGEVNALDGLSIEVPANQITVLLGPNGAGKTTAIRMITGALDPHEGQVRVFGLDPTTHGEEVRRRCGVVSAKPALYDRLSGHDNLAYAAELYGLGRGSKVDDRITASASRFGIEGALQKQVGGYSTGMKTRLALARSVLHEPDLLLYDEPTSGLDPESSHAVLEMIREMIDDGHTVLMCTHLLLEAEGLAERVVVLEEGRDLVSGSPDELTKRFWPDSVVMVSAEDPTTLDVARELPGVRAYHPGTPAAIQVDHMDRVPDLITALIARGVRLTRVEPHEPTLEDLYFAVRTRRDDAPDGGRQLSPTQRHLQAQLLTSWNPVVAGRPADQAGAPTLAERLGGEPASPPMADTSERAMQP
jgi:ABC-2 type transport system ATP-binding protein